MNAPQTFDDPTELRGVLAQLEAENRELRSMMRSGLVLHTAPETESAGNPTAQHPVLWHEPGLSLPATGPDPTRIQLIEGDNFEGLTALQSTHQGSVDVIYIDPPYNTGNNRFVYADRRSYRPGRISMDDPLRHSVWLSFMATRLRLARNLLADDGVIFVSIDDREQAHLKMLLDTIFGSKNFIANAIRKVKHGAGNDSKHLLVDYEYVLVYRKTPSLKRFQRVPVATEHDPKYRYTDEHVATRGKYYLREFQYRSSKARASTWTIELPNGERVPSDYNGKVGNEWRWGEKKFHWGLENDYIVFKRSRTGTWKVYLKQYQYADGNGNPLRRTVPPSATMDYPNGLGTEEVKRILGPGQFTYPKPTAFISHLVSLHPNQNATVLDFFAGSGTTGHAVAALNSADGGQREVILMTSNEGGEDDPEAGIARRITKERLSRVLTGRGWADGKDHDPVPGSLDYYTLRYAATGEDPEPVGLPKV